VPAGTFDAFRVEGNGWSNASKGGSVNVKQTFWIAPGVRRMIAGEIYRRHQSGKVLSNERRELTAYTQQ
jgi:hypothetical protein